MTKFAVVARREFAQRTRKPLFWILAIAGPLALSGALFLATWLNKPEQMQANVLVVDGTYPFFAQLPSGRVYSYTVSDMPIDSALLLLDADRYTAVLHIEGDAYKTKHASLYYRQKIAKPVVRLMEEGIQQYLEKEKLAELGISETDYRRLKTPFSIADYSFTNPSADPKAMDTLPMAVGLGLSVLVFVFLFFYSAQVMRATVDEKLGKIAEVMLSSVSPKTLLAGKLVGTGAVALLQFAIWIALGTLFTLGGNEFVSQSFASAQVSEGAIPVGMIEPSAANIVLEEFFRLQFTLLLGVFAVAFVAGYLLYSSLLAAVGSLADNDTELQSFVFPITSPLIVAYVACFYAVDNPHAPMVEFLTYFPFTSPVLLVLRLAINQITLLQLLASLAILIATTAFIVHKSATVYARGMLLQGQKISWSNVFKFL